MHISSRNSLLACLSSFIILSSPGLQAASTAPTLGSPTIAGSGCPDGSSQYFFSADNTTLVVLTQQYVAAPGNATCNIALPVSVPSGYQVTMKSLDFRGHIKGKAEVSNSMFYAGQTGPSLKTRLSSVNGKAFSQHDNLPPNKAACGKDVNVRLNSRIRTQTIVSSIGVGVIVLRLSYQRC